MNQEFYKQTEEYQSSSKIEKLWTDLSIAMNNIAPEESIIERRKKPWNSQFIEVQECWERLTAAENLDLLRDWYEPKNMNPSAKEATEMAIQHCEKNQIK